MAYPAKLSEESILETATQIVDEEGIESLSLRGIGARIGVKAPSLYKYFPDKESLMRTIGQRFITDLSESSFRAPNFDSLAIAYRSWARAHPHRYEAIFRHMPPGETPTLEFLLAAFEPLRLFAERSGAAQALPLARTLWSWLHGAVSLELAYGTRPRPGLDTEAAFALGLELLGSALKITVTTKGKPA